MKSVVVTGSFTIENVSDIQEQMRSALARYNGKHRIEVDLSEVTEFDGAGMQLLLAFRKAADKAGAEIDMGDLPDIIATTLRRFDVISRFTTQEAV